ncbi:glycoprotein-N-acetylgalactosamine 3-beta-galactosyltransferase [Skeletonema marinoi]|uniref:N-acetylgalactosaminide beta-1,3-galactosyltransferase n=1 Tax=Skeletonema marinoi TaxID=267567 RepID=A0AAD9D660_9STRA|nr:glycoprotein-N-acetylgalactosamine 3-beta-galactosyltransferase [Skeletonema marinoi]
MARQLRQAIHGVFGLLSMLWLCTTIYLFTSVTLPTSSRENSSKKKILSDDESRTQDTSSGETTIVNNQVNLTGIYFPALDENGNPGYMHNATTLHNNPPVFDTSGIQCGVNDATMQLLTQRVYVDLAAHERTNKLVLEGGGKPRAKIFCHIYTTQKQRPRIQSIRETWGNRCDGFHAASTITDRSIDSVNIPHEGKEEYNNMWQKVRAMWSYVYVNYFDSYDWFHIGGDDMYVLVENLRLYLESEEIETASNGGDQPLLLGQIFYQHGNRSATYVTGGGGYTLNKAALKMLVGTFPNCAPHDVNSGEDLLVTQCLKKEGIEPYWTTDETGAERYDHVSPEVEFNFDSKKNPLFWYSYYTGNENIGPQRVVKRAVSFHLFQSKPTVENMMRRVHAILYGHCANVTLGPPVPTKQWSDGKFLGRYWKSPKLQCELSAKVDEICICSMVKRGRNEVQVCKKHANNTSHQMQ